MGAHVWFPAYLRDHLLPRWRVAGWSPDWFGGFPAGQFYFPVPALVAVLARPGPAVQRRVQARRPRSVRCCCRSARTPSAAGSACAAPGPELFARSATSCSCSSRASRRGAPARRRQTTIQFNQRIMGGPLVSALAGEYSFTLALDARRSSSSARSRSRVRTGGARLARRGAARGDGAVATWSSGIFVVVGALVDRGCGVHRPLRRDRHTLGRGAAVGVGRRAAHRVLDRPARSRRSATRRTCGTRSSPGTSTTCSSTSSGGSYGSLAIVGWCSAIVRRDRAILTIARSLTRIFAARVPALARAARVEPALPAVLVPRRCSCSPRSARRRSSRATERRARPAVAGTARLGPDEDYEAGADVGSTVGVFRRRHDRSRRSSLVVILAIGGLWFDAHASRASSTSGPSGTRPGTRTRSTAVEPRPKPQAVPRVPRAHRHDGPSSHPAARCGRAGRRSTRTARRSR